MFRSLRNPFEMSFDVGNRIRLANHSRSPEMLGDVTPVSRLDRSIASTNHVLIAQIYLKPAALVRERLGVERIFVLRKAWNEVVELARP